MRGTRDPRFEQIDVYESKSNEYVIPLRPDGLCPRPITSCRKHPILVSDLFRNVDVVEDLRVASVELVTLIVESYGPAIEFFVGRARICVWLRFPIL